MRRENSATPTGLDCTNMESLRASLGISSNGHKGAAADYLVACPATEGDYSLGECRTEGQRNRQRSRQRSRYPYAAQEHSPRQRNAREQSSLVKWITRLRFTDVKAEIKTTEHGLCLSQARSRTAIERFLHKPVESIGGRERACHVSPKIRCE